MFPSCNIALIDNDCVPLALFEVADLIKICQQLPDWRTILEGSNGTPPKIGMILVTEPHFEHNAGLVISPASELLPPDMEATPDSLSQQQSSLLAEFLATSCPQDNPTTAATIVQLGLS